MTRVPKEIITSQLKINTIRVQNDFRHTEALMSQYPEMKKVIQMY